MNKAEILFDAITNVRPELIEEAHAYRFRRRTARWAVPRLAAAACIALLVTAVWWSGFFAMGGSAGDNYSGGSGWYGAGGNVDGSDGGSASPDSGNGSDQQGSPIGDSPPDPGANLYTVTAQVLEVREDGLLVEVLSGDGELLHQTLLLPAAALTGTAEAGDVVNVTWSGEIDWEREPPVLLGEITVETVQPKT